MPDDQSRPEFDEFAQNYDETLQQGLSLTGESKDYYARLRVQWLCRRLQKYHLPNQTRVIDYGCGTGSTICELHQQLNAEHVLGLDISEKVLTMARKECVHFWAAFATIYDFVPDGNIDVVYCNGTFHHIPPPQRPGTLRYIFECLKVGGFFALWENNPWNPGTRMVMKKIPFDKDAITLSIPESRRLLESSGFEVLRCDSLFYFPRPLAILRPLERYLSMLPLGGQYMVLARKPSEGKWAHCRSAEERGNPAALFSLALLSESIRSRAICLNSLRGIPGLKRRGATCG